MITSLVIFYIYNVIVIKQFFCGIFLPLFQIVCIINNIFLSYSIFEILIYLNICTHIFCKVFYMQIWFKEYSISFKIFAKTIFSCIFLFLSHLVIQFAIPCNAPHHIKFHPAPCQSPDTSITIKRFMYVLFSPLRLPPNGMYR